MIQKFLNCVEDSWARIRNENLHVIFSSKLNAIYVVLPFKIYECVIL